MSPRDPPTCIEISPPVAEPVDIDMEPDDACWDDPLAIDMLPSPPCDSDNDSDTPDVPPRTDSSDPELPTALPDD
jgi:hypothetical protein